MSWTVLVIDDDEDLREGIVELLQERGYDVDSAENGAAGLEHVEAQLPHLILLDMRMPVMGGAEFARIFRERHDRLTPIVVVTAAADAHRLATDIDAEGWLNKPFAPEDLYGAVHRHMRSCPLHEGAESAAAKGVGARSKQ